MALPENREKWGLLTFETTADQPCVRIKDEGDGFDWRPYLEMDPERATSPNGRGIATSRQLSFTAVEYIGRGNEVVCIQALDGQGAGRAAPAAGLPAPGSLGSASR